MCQGLSIPDWNQHKVKWEHLKNIPFPKANGRKTIDILIRPDHPELTLALTECYGPIRAPVARKTPLGWTYVGRLLALSSAKRFAFARTFQIQTLCETRLNEQLRRMWETDSLDDNQLNQEKILAMSKVTRSKQWIGECYEVAILWKEEFPSLPDKRKERGETFVLFGEKPHQEARSCETLQRSNECECGKGLRSEVRT